MSGSASTASPVASICSISAQTVRENSSRAGPAHAACDELPGGATNGDFPGFFGPVPRLDRRHGNARQTAHTVLSIRK
jgi:hypothetical protein